MSRVFPCPRPLPSAGAALIGAYMLYYFRGPLLTFLATMQIVLSLPITFFLMDVVLRQRPVSAFACCSIWVVTGVSADNIFVFHETWRQSKMLRVAGAPAPYERRVRWTLAQSAHPLLLADGTTAFSLFINCVSPITAVMQFGLCGGLLIMTNFCLVQLCAPAPVATPS